ncbi:hypothetical protein M2323_001630 [Rhodoblastus acidophilus]|uniref:hypothetical protein n=1 Tax=Rhodoblastus acidophilus TaxID=1074 RepID=UPI0022256A55|nr:hypothetical protein [Rhodoblastus acidophilus]MCW2284017.1 hypothetical protein [Rhodoblastus acidophilus]MCW2332713.1 hypothetical protein [Rhodoblastus acidophilus]
MFEGRRSAAGEATMATNSWTSPAIANWNTAAYWSAGVPITTSDCVILQGEAVVTSAIAVASLRNAAQLDFINAGSGAVTTGVINNGVLRLDAGAGNGGSNLTIGGLLTNTGVALLGAYNNSLSKSDTVTVAGLVNINGDLEVSGGTAATSTMLVNVTGAAGFGAAGLVEGMVRLSGYSTVAFASGGITGLDANSMLALNGANAHIALAGSLTSNSALTGLNLNAGTLMLDNGANLTTSAGLTNLGVLEVSSANINAPGSAVVIGGNLVNTGHINVENGSGGGSTLRINGVLTNTGGLSFGSGSLSRTTVVTVNGLSNASSGYISLTSGPTSAYLMNLSVLGAAGFGAAGVETGSVSISGYAGVTFASGQISTIQGWLSLSGAYAFVNTANASPGANSALAGLRTVTGSFSLSKGTTVTTTGSLAILGSVYLDTGDANGYGGQYGGKSQLTIGGVLTNSGYLSIGSSALTGTDTVTATGLVNNATISLTGSASPTAQAVLNITGVAGFGTAGVLSGQVNLTANALVEFASGQIASIASGASLTLNGPSAFVADVGALTSNSALKGLATNNGYLSLNNGAVVATAAGLTNTSRGSISLDANAPAYGGLLLNGGTRLTLGGALTNAGSLSVGSASLAQSDIVTATGLANTGSIILTGGASSSAQALLNVTGAAGFGTAGVLSGSVTLSGNSLLEFASGQIAAIASGASLTLNGPSAFVADAGALTSNSALKGLAANSGYLTLNTGAIVTTAAGLTNNASGSINLDRSQYSSGQIGGTRLTITGVLTNRGSLSVGTASLTNSDIVTATGVANTGYITLAGGASSSAQALLNITGAAGLGTVGAVSGQVNLSGNALVEFASGQITTIAGGATLSLDGANAFIADAGALTSNSALKGLATNSGYFLLQNGATVTTAAGLTNNNSSYIYVDCTPQNSYGYPYYTYYFGNGGSKLAVGGVLTNRGVLNIGNSNITNSDTVTATGLANTGSLLLQGGASSSATALLNVAGAAGFGTTGVLSGQVTLIGNAVLEFASGQIATIASGASLTLNGSSAFIADASALTSNSALQGLTNNGGNLYLYNGVAVTTTAGLTNAGRIQLDNYSGGSGGTRLGLGGVLTNNGSLSIDTRTLTNADSVTATGLANTGTITLTGDASPSAQALLNITGAAGFGTAGVLSGQVSLTGNAMVEFASGQITTIASGASLTLDGPSARIADAAALTSNSALAGLATNNGSLYLNNGVAVTTTGGLSNASNGYLSLDGGSYSYGTPVVGGTRLTLGGVLTNIGNLSVGSAGLAQSDVLTATGLSNTGYITLTGGSSASAQAVLNVTGAAGFGTAGVLKGQVNLSGNALVEFGSGQITTLANGASLTLNGPSAFVADLGALTSNSALKGLASNSGNLNLNTGAVVTTTAGLTNTSAGYVNLDNGYSSGLIGGTRLTVGGVLTNNGGLRVGAGSLMSSDIVTATGLANTGTITLQGGASSSAQALLNVTGAAGFGTAGVLSGQVSLSGNSLVEFASGQITTLASGATLTLNGPSALIADAGALTSNSALKGLATNSGSLYLNNGSIATSAGLVNNSNIYLDYNQYGTSVGGTSLTIGGVLTNKNNLSIGYYSSLTKSDTVTATGLANTGTITLTGGSSSAARALLNITGAAGFGSAGVLSGQVNLSGNALVEFASGQVTTIAAGASLSLDGSNAFVADAGALTSNSALKGLATNSGSLYFNNGVAVATAGAFTNSGYISLDSSSGPTTAGSSLSVGGTLTNGSGDTISIGSSYSPSPTTISASSGIVNNGYFQNYGDAIISSAVTGNGYFSLYGYGAAGAITEFDSSVGSGQTLYLSGTNELVFGAAAATTFAGTISGWAINDLIDVKGFGTGTTSSFSSNVLTLTNGSNVAHFSFFGVSDASHFSLTSSATETLIGYV